MTQKFVLFFILSIIFGINHIFAQKNPKPKEVVIIKFLIPNRSNYEKYEVPINKTFNKNNEIGMVSINECLDPTNEECRKTIYSSYEFTANATRINKNKSRIVFNIELTDECKTQRIFNVSRNRQTKIQLDCEVELIAYYGFEGEEAN